MGIKLSELIRDDIILEDKQQLIDKKIQKEIDELGEVINQIRVLKKKLNPLQKRYGELVDVILPVIDELGSETFKTKNYVFRILKQGYERKTFSYKEGFLNGLDKVNENTKRILKEILDETMKLTKIKPSFSVNPVESVGGTLKKWYNKFKGLVKRLTKNIRGIKDGNKILKRLV
jgi:hypothetical protein